MVTIALAAPLFYAGHKLRTRDANDLLKADKRQPVLYLRPFHNDGEKFEQNLAKIVTKIGPFIAIGKPGEKLSTLGANRMYVSNSEWQQKVLKLMKQSKIGILHIC